MRKSKFIPVFLIVTMLMSSFSVLAKSFDDMISDDEILGVKHIGHGEFKISLSKNMAYGKDVKAKKVKQGVYKLQDAELINQDKEYNKLIQVKKDTFLRVKELQIDLLDNQKLEKIIVEYDINDVMAEDIRKLAEEAKKEGSTVAKRIAIYTPKRSKTESTNESITASSEWTKKSGPYYYSGYKNYNYMDEIWHAENHIPPSEIKEGSSTVRYITETIKNIGEYFMDKAGSKKFGSKYVVAKLFFSDIGELDGYSANQDDYWFAEMDESKYKKYTSVEVWDDASDDYVYICRATGVNTYVTFKHIIYLKDIMSTSEHSKGKKENFATPNYYDLDEKAYERRNDYNVYAEDFKNFSPNGYTKFNSIR